VRRCPFTKAAAQLRVAQPELSRQVQDLQEEIGVDLLRRNSTGLTLTAEGKLFLEEVRELLKRADASVEKVRALSRGEYGESHVGYASVPTTEVYPDCTALAWNSQSWSSPLASRPQASSLNCCAPTRGAWR